MRNKTKYRLGLLLLVITWYGLTAIESLMMGVHPFARRAFTVFDYVLFVGIGFGVFWLYVRYRKKEEKN